MNKKKEKGWCVGWTPEVQLILSGSLQDHKQHFFCSAALEVAGQLLLKKTTQTPELHLLMPVFSPKIFQLPSQSSTPLTSWRWAPSRRCFAPWKACFLPLDSIPLAELLWLASAGENAHSSTAVT